MCRVRNHLFNPGHDRKVFSEKLAIPVQKLLCLNSRQFAFSKPSPPGQRLRILHFDNQQGGDSMASKDVTSIFGNTRFFLPLILIFFIAAGSALACPEHTGKAAHRTKAIGTRSVSYMTPVVITFGGRCADDRYSTRRVKYVSMRDNGFYEGGARYVAVRKSVPLTRYVAVRDYEYAPRYVSVRPRPAYVDYATRYVGVQNYVPRQRVVAVHHKEIGDVSYVAVQRIPAVDDVYDRLDRRTVAVRTSGNGCASVVRSCLGDAETTGMTRVVYRNGGFTNGTRHVVVKSDYIDGTQAVIVPSSSFDDDSEFIAAPNPDRVKAKVVEYEYDDVYVPASFAADPCARRVAVRTCGDVVNTRTVGYLPKYDDVDFDDQDLAYNNGVTYFAADDMEDSCLPRAVVYTSPANVRSRAVSYVPMDEVDDASTYIVADDSAHPPLRQVSSYRDEDLIDSSTAYIADDNVDESCACDVGHFSASPMSYVPIENVRYAPVETVSLVPVANVRYGRVASAGEVNFDDGDCEANVTTRAVEPVSYIDSSDVAFGGNDVEVVAENDPYLEHHNAQFYSDVGYV
jgi:hypothetical protein